jgi:hypothetical protein
MRTGEDLEDVRRGIEIVDSYLSDFLPPTTAGKLVRQTRENSALYALGTARRLFVAGEMVAGTIQIRKALKCSCSLNVLLKLGLLVLSGVAHQIRCVADTTARSACVVPR